MRYYTELRWMACKATNNSVKELHGKKKNSHGKFILSLQLEDGRFSNYYPLMTRDQFNDVHLLPEGEAAKKKKKNPKTKEKSAVLLQVQIFDNKHINTFKQK